MQRIIRWGCTLLIVLCTVGPVVGCRSSTHHKVYIYEYNNEPNTQRKTEPQQKREGEWKMVSPGEMVVDPPRGG